MTDARLVVLAALLATGAAFFAGVRLAFLRPGGEHPYRASRVSGGILVAEALAVALSPVPRGRALASVAVLGTALAFFLWAVWANRNRKLGLAFAGGAPEHLQTAGPYRLVRHPFYASYLLAFLGGALAAGTAWLVPALAAGAYTYWRAARGEEEAFARSPLAESYARYAARVGMFVPRPAGSRQGSATGSAAPASSRRPEGKAG